MVVAIDAAAADSDAWPASMTSSVRLLHQPAEEDADGILRRALRESPRACFRRPCCEATSPRSWPPTPSASTKSQPCERTRSGRRRQRRALDNLHCPGALFPDQKVSRIRHPSKVVRWRRARATAAAAAPAFVTARPLYIRPQSFQMKTGRARARPERRYYRPYITKRSSSGSEQAWYVPSSYSTW